MSHEIISSFVEVVLPLPLASTFTYSLPEVMQGSVGVGSRVIVPFGKKKFYTGIVAGFAPAAPREYEVKEVIHVLDAQPVLRHPQLRFWEWMAGYYMCSLGEVYNAAVPGGLKIESETQFELNPDFDMDDASLLSEREVIAAQLLSSKSRLTALEIQKETGFRNVTALMNKMVERGVAILSESLVEKYRPKREKCVRAAFERGSDEALRAAFAAVRGAKKQETLLMTLIHLTGFTVQGRELREVTQTELLEKSGCSATILKALADKGIVERYTRETSRFGHAGGGDTQLPELTAPQMTALDSIHASFLEKPTTLLFGVTASGKTEIYAHLVDYAMKQGSQVLYLVPEIALTTQLTQRLRRYFGDKLLVYHSKFSDNERVEIWNRLLHGNSPCVVVGTRSSLFLPFAKLDLIIVDEEHDQSYKQFDPAPRYNARDSAIMLAHMHGAKTLLGSGTPAVDTFYKAQTGKYALVQLKERFQGVEMPAMEMVDMSKEWKKKAVKGSLADITLAALKQTVEAKRQGIIFLNRRGYAPMARCTQCQYVPKCKNCDVSLTYHKRANTLICHYCGATYPLSDTCPACKQPAIEIVGYGTERVEDAIDEQLPEARTLRMDLDTTRNKNSYASMIELFSERKADLLVGTQMVTKGLDFDGVDAVAVVNADSMINFPDYRSAERAFCMLEQVAGRAGRKNPGRVLVQTYNPAHPILQFVEKHDYEGFYHYELEERKAYAYPPFTKLIYVYLKHRDERELDNLASVYAAHLRELFGTRVQGPGKPGVARVQNYYIRQVMVKVEPEASVTKVKEVLQWLHADMRSKMPAMRGLVLYYDVDPA